MLEKLLSLLLHAKAGAISGVFLLGATGALVSVSVSNGVTTITLTDPSASPSASPSPSASASARPSSSPSARPSASASPSSSPSSSKCSDEAKAIAFQVKRVDTAFKTFHTDLMQLRSTRDRATVEKADKLLRAVRHSAVKAIHATATCRKHEHDEDESHDATTTSTSLNDDKDKDEDADKDEDHGKPAGLTFTGDATSIAGQAIVAMQTAFDTAKNAPAKTAKPDSSHKPEAAHTSRPSHKPESQGSSHH